MTRSGTRLLLASTTCCSLIPALRGTAGWEGWLHAATATPSMTRRFTQWLLPNFGRPNFDRQRAGNAFPFHTTVRRDCRTNCIPARSAANHRFVTG
jgi:hypothetical protein